jgi:CRISPR-associated protein Cmr6
MFKGILRITKLISNLKSEINNKPYNIKNFEIPNEFNNKECHFELDDNNEVIKIEINGQIFELNKICKNQHRFKIPKDTCIAIEKTSIDNFHLKLNRYAEFNYNDGYKLQHQNINKDFFDNDWKDFYKSKIDKYYKDIRELNLKFLEIELKTYYRLVIGSEQSIYETSIRLHHIYGIPYIPSSAIKGVLRGYTILECFSEELEKYSEDKYQKFEEEVLFAKDEDGNYKHQWFIDIFGSQEQKGEIIFFDSFSKDVKIQKDIMTPHYGDYYDKKKKVAPTDTQSPNPIPFLTVIGKFRFFIASKKNDIEKYKIRDKSIKEWLQEALTNHGIGAKTAVGYGYFR